MKESPGDSDGQNKARFQHRGGGSLSQTALERSAAAPAPRLIRAVRVRVAGQSMEMYQKKDGSRSFSIRMCGYNGSSAAPTPEQSVGHVSHAVRYTDHTTPP